MTTRAIVFAVAFGLAGVAGGPYAPAESSASSLVTVTRVPHNGIQPEVALDGRGVVHMLYFAGEPRTGNLFFVRSTDFGATFTAPVQVNSQNGSAIAAGTIRGGQLAIGRDGRVHIVWNGSETAVPRGPANPRTGRPSSPLLYARSNVDGTAFEAQRNVIRRSYSLDGGGSIAADQVGNVYAAWHANGLDDSDGEDRRRVWLARSQDDGATFSAEDPAWSETTGACGCCGLRLLAHGRNQLSLLYRSASGGTNRDMYLLGSSNSGQSFRGSRVHPWNIGTCPMTSMTIAAVNSRVVGAWETDGQIYFGDVDPVTARIFAPLRAPGSTIGRKHPRVAIGPRGTMLVVWTEGTTWARGGSLAWHVFDASGKPTGAAGATSGVPPWSFAAVVARPDGGFTIFY